MAICRVKAAHELVAVGMKDQLRRGELEVFDQ